MRPRLLDLFCGGGGSSMGYHRAGFDVTGVDIAARKRYPFTFIQADALEYLRCNGHNFDAIAASPPCQHYTNLRHIAKGDHPDLVAVTREALIRSGKPYVIENVEGAPLLSPITLCGTMFPPLRVYRHRLFESNVRLTAPCHGQHKEKTLQRRYAHGWPGFLTVTGSTNHPKSEVEQAMGIDWMSKAELSQAIPPAYTEHLGRQLLAYLNEA